MPERCWSVFSADRSAASIARALPSSRSTPAGARVRRRRSRAARSARLGRAGGKRRRRCPDPATTIGCAGIHLGGEACILGNRRVGRDVAARAEVLGKNARDEIVEIEVGGKRHGGRLGERRAADKVSASAPRPSRCASGHPEIRSGCASAASKVSPLQALTVTVTRPPQCRWC